MISVAILPRYTTRMRAGLAYAENWWQAARFLAVGASGFAINLAVFSALVHGAGMDYRLAAVCSNLVALANNFLWNRRWTFKAKDGPAGMQASRFVLVSLCGFVVNLMVLQFAVEFLAVPKLASETLASACAAPVNFLGSRQWAFRSGRSAADGAMTARAAVPARS